MEAEFDPGTDSYALREYLAVSRFPKRDQRIRRADMKLVGLREPPARSRSFIPPPSWLMWITVAHAIRSKQSLRTIAIPNQRELTCCLEMFNSDSEENVSEGESDPGTPQGDDNSHNKQRFVLRHQREDIERRVCNET